ncbi:hypothetical protein [Streptomyces olivaceiscleroticus]|uniref:Phosphatidic acid phosphatase type 2/haloperoxidase domain-containing protein n=1 Tax=Streptomyces olivaceiscleroticus TaxID=68245 RepID=A0ABN0ZYV7_9ACTN
MSVGSARGGGWPDRVAAWVTGAATPTVVLATVLVAIGWHSTWPAGTGLVWGAVVGVFCGGVPHAVLHFGVHRKWWSDRHVRAREQRPIPLLVTTASVTAGALTACLVPEVPHELTAATAVMLCGAICVLAISTVWKISIHTSVTACAMALTVPAFGPQWLWTSLVVPLVAWSRVRLRDHTLSQVLGGTLLGLAVPTLVHPPVPG